MNKKINFMRQIVKTRLKDDKIWLVKSITFKKRNELF